MPALLALPLLAASLLHGPARSPADSIVAAHRADRAPVVDGKDDDPVWRGISATSSFRQFQPREDTTPTFRTEFKVAYDDHNLYVFVRAFDAHPDSIMHALSRRDVRGPSDQIIVLIDGYNDRRTGYEFDVNPDGVKRDYAIYNDGNEDDSWNGVWDVATRVDSAGWTAEFRIPFSQIRYADRATHTFGFGVWRDIERYKERVSWPLYRQTKNGFVSQIGRVTGIDNIASPHRLELTPYTVAKNVSRERTAGFDRLQQGSVGADVKYGVTPNLTLDATVNPDFGQVESDPAVLNLSAFETFLSERRPFFIEGSGLYRFDVNCSAVNCGGEGLFYSRRIGRAPQLLDTYGDASSPTSTPILAAGKLTGRTQGGLSIGVVDALTDAVQGTVNRTIEPRTNYAVFRAQQDLRDGQSGIGLIATAVDRSLDQWTDTLLRSQAYVGGATFRHRMFGNQYELYGALMETRVEGSAQAIASTQRNSAHYYQRPDGALHFDSTRTSLTGDAEEIAFGKFGGGVTRFQTSYLRQSAGYEINDLGFLRRADEQGWATWTALSFRNPHWFYKSAQINANHWASWTTSGLLLENAVNTNTHINLTNNWWVHAGGTLGQLGGAYCDRCTRGGPALRRAPYFAPWFGLNVDDRKAIAPSLFFNFNRSDDGRSSYVSVDPSADIRIVTQLQASVGLDLSHAIDDNQWIDNYVDAGGTHYTFARLNQHTLSFNTRLSYAATPTLTLELYAQPFITSGSYSNVRQTSALPWAANYDDRYAAYTPPPGSTDGFDVVQLRSNTVVRWEYRPGSTLFVVWTHGRDGSDSFHDRSVGDEYRDMFSRHPDNTFLVKVAYWINR